MTLRSGAVGRVNPIQLNVEGCYTITFQRVMLNGCPLRTVFSILKL
jgi:hypothetical protein